MIACGSQCMVCDYPVHLDTYRGCTHGCKYCFANETVDVSIIKPLGSVVGVKKFIAGSRTRTTKFIDWKIPLHWGGNSDPFQPCEAKYKKSLEVLQVFADTGYPFIVSTKGALIAKEPYISLLAKCNVVVQISMACPSYDKLEKGATTFNERLEIAKKLSPLVPRVIARIQPFFPDKTKEIIEQLPRMKEAGIYGVIVESYTSLRKRKGMEKDGADYLYPLDVLVPRYQKVKEVCHENGLRFFCGEDRVRWLGDSLTCCGTEGLELFQPNKYNVEHLAHEAEEAKPTEAMQKIDTAFAFKAIHQQSKFDKYLATKSFCDMLQEDGNGLIAIYREYRKLYSKFDKG